MSASINKTRNYVPLSTPTWRLNLRPDGMFSNVNEVIQQVHLALENRYRFSIDWSRSCYRDESRACDPWLYYFQPCFPEGDQDCGNAPALPGGAAIACTKANVITPRLSDGKCDPLLLPVDRHYPGSLIEKFIRVNADVDSQIEEFSSNNFTAPVIGVHIRGAGRTDGGAPELRARFQLVDGVPLDLYFSSVEEALSQCPGARIFACSDSSKIIDAMMKRFGETVFTYSATRSDFGEMHANHPNNEGVSFPRAKLGKDVVVEAHLLAQTSFFVHGNSNLANFVLCKNPNLKHKYVYE